jgi:hypothetical protein
VVNLGDHIVPIRARRCSPYVLKRGTPCCISIDQSLHGTFKINPSLSCLSLNQPHLTCNGSRSQLYTCFILHAQATRGDFEPREIELWDVTLQSLYCCCCCWFLYHMNQSICDQDFSKLKSGLINFAQRR